MDQVREVLRYHHYAYRTEQTFCQWILRCIHCFGGKTHPKLLGSQDIERFLSNLATVGTVSASTRRQALHALIFLYREVAGIPLTEEIAPIRSNRQQKPPTVLIQTEVQRLLAAITGKHAPMAKLLYGGGLRLMECFRLRVQDVDFGQGLIFIRGGKGGKDRTTILPKIIEDELQKQVQAVKTEAMPTSKPPRSIPMSWPAISADCKAHWTGSDTLLRFSAVAQHQSKIRKLKKESRLLLTHSNVSPLRCRL